MKKVFTLMTMFVMTFGMTLSAADNTYMDYQNYNHGYCSECNCAPCGCDQPCAPLCDACQQPCNSCDPCAPVCGAECGISLCAIGIGVAAVAVAAALIIASGSGSSSSHSHS